MKGYVQLRRGLLEHFKIMTASEIKVYVGILILANYKSAMVNITLAELSDIVFLDKKIVLLSLHRLEALGYVKYTPAKNQWHANSIEIINYNGKVKNTIPTPIATPTPMPIPTPIAKVVTTNEINDLQNPNKYKEVLRNIKKVSKDTAEGQKMPSDTYVIQKYFYQRFKEVFNREYIANFGKDGKIFKDLLVKILPEELKYLIDAYLITPDKFVEENGYSIGIFKSRINSLRIEKRTGVVSDKTLKSAISLNSWMKKTEAKNVR